MGTYDTRGGSPLSPNMDDPTIYPEEEIVLSILEAADVSGAVNDQVAAVVARVCEREAVLKALLRDVESCRDALAFRPDLVQRLRECRAEA